MRTDLELTQAFKTGEDVWLAKRIKLIRIQVHSWFGKSPLSPN